MKGSRLAQSFKERHNNQERCGNDAGPENVVCLSDLPVFTAGLDSNTERVAPLLFLADCRRGVQNNTEEFAQKTERLPVRDWHPRGDAPSNARSHSPFGLPVRLVDYFPLTSRVFHVGRQTGARAV